MSRSIRACDRVRGRFPRVSGDEPEGFTLRLRVGVFSPRERG